MLKVFLKKDSVENLLATKHMSQNWLALKIGISSGYISQLIKGERCPSPKVRQRIHNLFKGKEFDDLFYIKEQEPNLN